MIRHSVCVFIAGWCAGLAAAQAPSFIAAPAPIGQFSAAAAISPDGRYVAGPASQAFITAPRLFRWEPASGSHSELFNDSPVVSAVLNDGRVFWYFDRIESDSEQGRISIWQPDTAQNITLPGPADPGETDFLAAVSPDGQFLLGYSAPYVIHTPRSPWVFDISTGSPFRFPLDVGPGNIFMIGAGITLPDNGARFAYCSVSGNGTVTGMNWFIPNPFPAVLNREVRHISPRADYMLGKVGAIYYLYGDGAARALNAPLSPVIMSDPRPVKISDDGSVVVGAASDPLSANVDAVVWRKGAAPARFKDILTAAGVAVPFWSACSLTGVSADGSTVIGTYQVVIDQDLHAFCAVLPALNDNCSTARPVSYGTVISSTRGATRAGVSGACASEGTAPDVWFTFVPVANEIISIDTCGSSFDTTLALYQASTCGGISTPLACNDDASPACGDNVHASRLSASVFAGQNYYIRVSGWNGAYGSIRLTLTAPNRPANDSCAQATDVAPGTGVPFNNTSAITDSRPPCGGTPFNDVWFRSVAPESGRMTFSTCGSTINTVVNVYDSSACGDLNAVPLACGSANAACQITGGGNGTRITVPCTAGQVFLIRVGGLFGSSGGGTFSSNFACDQNNLSTYNVAVLNSQPLDYYRFDDSGALTAADAVRFDAYSCGDNRGQYMGSVYRPDAYQGRALDLHGDGAHARIWGPTPITTQCASATVEAWVNTRDPLAGVVFTNRNAPGETSLTMVIGYNTIGLPGTQGRVMFIADGPGNFHGAISNQRVDDGRWHHVVGRRILSGLNRYSYDIAVDGVSSTLNNLPGVGTANSGTNGTYWLIGNGTAWPVEGAAFNGKIDEVAVYCGSLPPQTIVDHYNIGKPCLADINYDHVVDFFDYLDFVEAFDAQAPEADFNLDTVIDFFDYLDFLTAFNGPC